MNGGSKELEREREAIKQKCLSTALESGFWSGLKASIVCGGLYYAAWTYSPMFRHTFNVSARTALTVMPIFYSGWLNVEQSMFKCMQEQLTPTFVKMNDD